MKEEEKDKEIEELEKEIQRLGLEYRKLLYESSYKYIVPPMIAFAVLIIGSFVSDSFSENFSEPFARVVAFLIFAFLLPLLIKSTLLSIRINKLYRKLAEKKGGVITGFIGDEPVFLRRWSRKRPRRF